MKRYSPTNSGAMIDVESGEVFSGSTTDWGDGQYVAWEDFVALRDSRSAKGFKFDGVSRGAIFYCGNLKDGVQCGPQADRDAEWLQCSNCKPVETLIPDGGGIFVNGVIYPCSDGSQFTR